MISLSKYFLSRFIIFSFKSLAQVFFEYVWFLTHAKFECKRFDQQSGNQKDSFPDFDQYLGTGASRQSQKWHRYTKCPLKTKCRELNYYGL